MRQMFRRVWFAIRHRQRDDELAEEMAFHRAMKQDEMEARGMDPADAALAARRAFGSAALARDRARDVWIWPWLQDILQDVRFAARLLAKDRHFTLAAVVALALGIAATNTVFTFINTALFKDLPFEDARRLVEVQTLDQRGRPAGLSYPDLLDLQRATRTLGGLAASAYSAMNVSDEARAAERFRGSYLSANTLDVLRARPVLGRGFLPEDDRPGAAPVVILGDDVWRGRYGADPTILGRTIRVNDVPSIVVGVMAARFSFPGTAELWQPMALMPGAATAPRNVRNVNGIGRLADGVTIEQARSEVTAMAQRLARDHPETNQGIVTTVDPPLAGPRRFMRPTLATLMGAVLCVLLIACANVANLLLARAAHRSREIAIRASLGATRWRIVRQLFMESVLLALLAGAFGLLLSVYSVRYFGVAFDAMELGAPDRAATPYWINLSMDATVFAFVAALCLGSSVLFGLAPALHISKTNVNDILKESGRSAAGSVRARRWTGALMVVELALTVILLAGAGLMARSFVALYRTDFIIDPSHLVTGRISLPPQKYATVEARGRFFSRLDDQLAANRAIDHVTTASDIPFTTLGGSVRQLAIDGRADPAGLPPPNVSYVYVGADYFETLDLPLTHGRGFVQADGEPGHEGAIVNQRFATLFFPHDDVLGQRIRVTAAGGPNPPPGPWLTIVGVVPTLPQFGPREVVVEPLVYVPIGAEPAPGRFVSIIARGRDATAIVAQMRNAVRALDLDLPVYSAQTMPDLIVRMRFPNRLMGALFGLLALIALVLSTVGLFALTAHGVAQRTQEIGVRMALGAQTRQVVWLFLRRTMAQLAIGLTLGLAGALFVGKLLQMFLVRTDPRDPLTLVAISVLLAIVAVGASVLPARRAARVDPVVALRYE
jgi:putative ABC transport system permease protein